MKTKQGYIYHQGLTVGKNPLTLYFVLTFLSRQSNCNISVQAFHCHIYPQDLSFIYVAPLVALLIYLMLLFQVLTNYQ